jgi:hypothetical protein
LPPGNSPRGAHLGGVLGNLAQLEMRDFAVDPDVTDAIKESF